MLNAIYAKMAHQIRCDLTIGMADADKSPYSNAAVAEFIAAHHEKILLAAKDMYDTHLADGDLATLGDGSKGCDDWYREFLYEYVDLPFKED